MPYLSHDDLFATMRVNGVSLWCVESACVRVCVFANLDNNHVPISSLSIRRTSYLHKNSNLFWPFVLLSLCLMPCVCLQFRDDYYRLLCAHHILNETMILFISTTLDFYSIVAQFPCGNKSMGKMEWTNFIYMTMTTIASLMHSNAHVTSRCDNAANIHLLCAAHRSISNVIKFIQITQISGNHPIYLCLTI